MLPSISVSSLLIHAILRALFFKYISVIDSPACSLLWVMMSLHILCGLLFHKKLNNILSILFKYSIGGDGSTDSLYINWDSRSDLIIVTLPMRVNFLWDQILTIFSIFSMIGSRFLSLIAVNSADIFIPSTVSGPLVLFSSGSVVSWSNVFLVTQFSELLSYHNWLIILRH